MRKNSLDLTQGSIVRKMIAFMVPLLANKALSSFYNTADRSILGHCVGDAAMAACGVTGAPFVLFTGLFGGISVGVTVCCGNLLGAKKQKELEDCMYTSVCTGFLVGLVLIALGIPLSRYILQAVGAPKTLMSDALLYFRIRFLSTPVTMTNLFIGAIMSAYGDTRRQVLIGAVSGLSNVLMNLLLVMVIPWGIFGVALATALSELLGMIWRLCLLFSSRGQYRLKISKLHISWKCFWDVLQVGVPVGLNTLVFRVANVLLQSTVNSFGPDFITANSIADSVADYASIAYSCVPQACITGVAQCMGAKKYDRIDKIMNMSLLCCHIGVTLCSAVVLVFARPMLGMFTKTPEVVEIALPKVIYYCVGYFIHTFGQIYVAGIKGLKKSTLALFLNLFSVCVPRVLWIWLVVPLSPTPNTLYLIYPVSWLISAVSLGIGYYSCRRKLIHQPATT